MEPRFSLPRIAELAKRTRATLSPKDAPRLTPHCPFAVTVNTPPSLRPFTAECIHDPAQGFVVSSSD